MFTCFNPNKHPGPKCEWVEGNLRRFVERFNQLNGTTYELAECLDIPNPNRPFSATKQPEVLVIGNRSEQPMVIERKQVVTESYARHHANQHLLHETIPSLLATHFVDDLYVLSIDESSLENKTKAAIQAEALQIAGMVLDEIDSIRSGRTISRRRPFPWVFGRCIEALRDENAPKTGIGIYISSKDILDLKPEESRLVIDRARNNCREILVRRLSEAEEKFKAYRDHLKVLVLECYGPWWALDENDIAIFLSQEALSPLIDQIWMAVQDWLSEWDYEIGYKRLR
jgi:hypothetical protein